MGRITLQNLAIALLSLTLKSTAIHCFCLGLRWAALINFAVAVPRTAMPGPCRATQRSATLRTTSPSLSLAAQHAATPLPCITRHGLASPLPG
jgi:hypothetical protein